MLLDDVAKAITEAWGERAVNRADVTLTLAEQTAHAAIAVFARYLREPMTQTVYENLGSLRALANHIEGEGK